MIQTGLTFGEFVGAWIGPATLAVIAGESADPVETTGHPWLAAATIVFVLAVLAGMFLLVYWDRREMWKTQQMALTTGASTTLSDTSLVERRLGASSKLSISGGTVDLSVGSESPEFVASISGKPVEVDWFIAEGAKAAELGNKSGSTTKLTGKAPGALRLRAAYTQTDESGQNSPQDADVLVAVHPKPTGGSSLALSALGKGLGLFVLSLAALGLGVAAAFTGQLSTELATFLGTAFGVGAGAAAVVGTTRQEGQGSSRGNDRGDGGESDGP